MSNTLRNLFPTAACLGLLTLGSATVFAADQSVRRDGDRSQTTTENAPSYESNQNRRSGDAATSGVSRGDRRFILKAAEHGKNEVKLSSLAAERATDPGVRSYAQRLVSEHEQANQELAALARRKGVDVDAEVKDSHENKHMNKLNDKSGAEFDRAYIKEMANAHDDVVDLFEGAAKKADDPEISAFANKMLPALRDHKTQAENLQKTLKK